MYKPSYFHCMDNSVRTLGDSSPRPFLVDLGGEEAPLSGAGTGAPGGSPSPRLRAAARLHLQHAATTPAGRGDAEVDTSTW
jgi:hypothetical protein